jgi:predicted acylesterase/phospholipase RssA/CRP-like cAMP-binding protein
MAADLPPRPHVVDVLPHDVLPPPREVAPGEVLVQRGDLGGDAYLVESGCLDVVGANGDVVAQVCSGELVGEFVALVGGERTATVRAGNGAASTVRPLSGEVLESVLRRNPELAAQVRREAAARIQETRVREILAGVVGLEAPEVVAALVDRGAWRPVPAGERLFDEGDDARSAFVLVSGRLRQSSAGDAVAGYLAAGSVVGEEGLAGGRRRVTMEAVRDSVVLEIGSKDFAALLVDHPRVLAPVALGLAGGQQPPRRDLDRTVALAVTADVDRARLTAQIVAQMGRLGRVAHLSSVRVDSMLDRPGIAQAAAGDPGEIRLMELLARLERESCYVVVEPDEDDTEWTSRVLRQADVLAVIASASPDAREQSAIDALVGRAGLRTLRTLVLLHPEGTDRPRDTSATVDRWHADHVLHARSGSASDVGRVARALAGRPVGLVLGGGGARGFAALGAYQALSSLGVPVDAAGGTSIGAPLAAAIAQGVAPDDLVDSAEALFHGILDYTLPMVSLLKGERTSASIRAMFDGWTIEDFWLPYFCISTNLTQGRMQIHRRGDVSTALRASVAIPGAFPPVPYGDDLLVDGGVTNNLPADVMRRLYPTSTTVAVSVAPVLGPKAKADYGLSVSGWQAMKSKVGRGPRYPGIVAVLMRSMITGSMDRRDAVVANGDADLLLDLDMRGVGLLDFERVREVAAKGYDAAMPRLEQWLADQADVDGSVLGVLSGG